MILHNMAASKKGIVNWEDIRSGPESKPIWAATVFINGIRFGVGAHNTKQGARDAAAKEALKMFGQESSVTGNAA